MSNSVIEVNNLSKLYRLGEIGTGTISHDLNRWWSKVRGKEDPYAILGEENARDVKANSDWVWALKDVSFSINRGEVFGIVGKNGAGKSTLLKLLSRVTSPTTGIVRARGRIASLLEVGTGFHPDLTGRDNIFLNGAILGMTRREIKSKFDRIVEFAGVERYVNTPVKRYSSGMYVRLAFAVAAHLEPEILIVDEVLAVGDAEFQKKCLGKMKDVSTNEGRTVLFVSHNMTAVRSLCNSGMFLSKGRVSFIGDISETINKYQLMFSPAIKAEYSENDTLAGNDLVRLKAIQLETKSEKGFLISEPLKINLALTNLQVNTPMNVNIFFNTLDGTNIFATCSMVKVFEKGSVNLTCKIPANFLNDGIYSLDVMAVTNSTPILTIKEAITIEGIEPPREAGWLGKFPGYIRPAFEWVDGGQQSTN